MKTVFQAQWNDNKVMADPHMTRDRASKLIRAWRRNSKKNSNQTPWIVKREGLHKISVMIPNYFPQETHTISWVKI